MYPTRIDPPAQRPATIAWSAMVEAQALAASNPALASVVKTIEEIQALSAKAQMQGREELAHEFAALACEGCDLVKAQI